MNSQTEDAELESRVWSRVNKGAPGGCWLWTGSTDTHGYAKFKVDGRSVVGHRWFYERLVGPIPAGLQIDHLCRVRHCVNPGHLEPVTPRENTLRSSNYAAQNAVKTHCAEGHPYDDANTYRWRNTRCCKTCRRAYRRRRYAAKRGER